MQVAYFSNAEIEKLSLSSLTSYNSVTPGDFGRLAGKIRFMDEEEISSEMIIQELCDMQEEKDGSKCVKLGLRCKRTPKQKISLAWGFCF